MSKNSRFTSEIISFPNVIPDPLEKAGRAAVDALRRVAATAEESTQVALRVVHKTTLQLQAAEERIAQLETEVQLAHARAQKAEQWLYTIAAEIEQTFDRTLGDRKRSHAQSSPEVYAGTGAEMYAPKKRMQEGEFLKNLGDLLQDRSLSR